MAEANEAMDSAVGVHRQESQSLFLFKKDAAETPEEMAAREQERLVNQQLADKMADEERERRISELKDREDEVAIVRQINIEYSIAAADEEKERRVMEYEVAKVQDQIIRERRKSEAIDAMEAERQRRISEAEQAIDESEQERAKTQEMAVDAMEKERVRRLSSSEHVERMPSGSWSITKPKVDGSDDGLSGLVTSLSAGASPTKSSHETDGFSEIPVVQASASKILVDEHSERRCFISSEHPEEEKDKLHALRQSLEDDLKDVPFPFQDLVGDVRLLRFLRGHKMNVAVAATKYREMLALRKKHKLDEIRQTIADKNMTPEDFPHYDKMLQHLPFLNAYDLLDADGSNVFYFEMSGYADFRGLLDHVTDDEWQTFFAYDMEYRAMRLDQLSRQHEKVVQTIFVRNLTGFSIARFHPKLLKRLPSLLSLATKCYPETTRQTILLHTPWIFHKIWSGITSWLHETQLRKIIMKSDAYSHLVTLVGGREKLPKLLGGKSTTHVIPQTAFLGKDSYLLLCDDGATPAEIRAGGILQLPFRMNVNDTICWEYHVKSHDLDFGVKFRTQGDGGAQEVDKVAKKRTMAGETVADSYTATEDGTVVLYWDNSYSWARGKQVAYKAKVVKSTHDFSSLDISGNDCV